MKQQVVAKVYAKALCSLAQNESWDIVGEFGKIIEVINKSNDLEKVLFFDAFKASDKKAVLEVILDKISTPKTLKSFSLFLIEENRMSLLPQIYKEAVVLDDESKGFMKGTIEGRNATIDPKIEEQIKNYLFSKIGIRPEFNYIANDKLLGGLVVKVGDWQLDATIDNQLNEMKKSLTK